MVHSKDENPLSALLDHFLRQHDVLKPFKNDTTAYSFCEFTKFTISCRLNILYMCFNYLRACRLRASQRGSSKWSSTYTVVVYMCVVHCKLHFCICCELGLLVTFIWEHNVCHYIRFLIYISLIYISNLHLFKMHFIKCSCC